MTRARALLSQLDRAAVAVGVIVLLGLVLRTVALGRMTLHHDESLHAYYAWRLAEGLGYQHDPMMHGPLQFHVLALCFALLGDHEWTARLFAALTGSALIATPLLFRRWLGGAGAVIAAVLLCLSPTLLYYSRFARNDVPVALWTVLLIAAVLRFREDGRTRWLALLSVALALQFVTKETSYLVAATLLLALDASVASALASQLVDSGCVATHRRWWWTVGLVPFAWLIAATWRLTWRWRERYGIGGARPREVDLLVVTGTLVLPTLGAATQLIIGPISTQSAQAIVVVLLAASAAVGLLWDARRWAWLAAMFFTISVLLYTTVLTNVHGIGGLFWTSLQYWIEQHQVRRGGQPWFYYGLLTPLYEFAALLPIIGSAWALTRRWARGERPLGNRYVQLFSWWLAATFGALSIAGEKMPWLAVHIALPLALLAAWCLTRWLPGALWQLRATDAASTLRARTVLGLGVVALVAAYSVQTAYGVVFAHPDTPVEPLIYTQSAPDLRGARDAIDAYATASGSGHAQPIVVDTAYALTWPWAWYLRHYTAVRYEDIGGLPAAAVSPDAVVIAAHTTILDPTVTATRGPQPLAYHHRWWFPEDGYRTLSAGSLWREVRAGTLLPRVGSFLRWRVPERSLGSVDGDVWFPARQLGQR